MSEYSINIVKRNVDKELFLRLPSKLYDERHIVQNKSFEKEVLENTSVLCKGVKNFAFIVKICAYRRIIIYGRTCKQSLLQRVLGRERF